MVTNKKFYLIGFIIGIFCTEVVSIPLDKVLKNEEGQSLLLTPFQNETLDLINLEEIARSGRLISENDVIFRLYTRNSFDSGEILEYQNSDGLKSSNYGPSKPTKIVVHGWNGGGLSEINTLLKTEYLKTSDVNVICVDWEIGALGSYVIAAINVEKVGSSISRFTDWLINEGARLEDFHYIGHSLGAHALGMAGRSLNSGKIPYITALDPALPLWGPLSKRIKKGDAIYVEVIHTNAGVFGIPLPIGDNDFYPNGGSHMPGCSKIDLACSHSMAYRYFANSIGNENFKAIHCTDLIQVVIQQCSNSSWLWMGGEEMKPSKGIFYLKTSDAPPYYLN